MMKKKIVSFTLDEHIIKRLQNEAKIYGVSVSAYLTMVLKGKVDFKL